MLFGDTDIAQLSEARRDRFRAEHIGFVFQSFNLLQGLSALENVALAHRFAGASGAEAQRPLRRTYSPRPGRPRKAPFSTMTSPRDRTVSVTPFTRLPS